MRRLPIVILLLAPGSLARLEAQPVQRRDSAGAAVVTSAAAVRPSDPRYQLRAAPELELGSDIELSSIRAAFRLGGGRFVVAERSTSQLHLFDPAGKRLATVGRKGAGPGEYQRIDAAFPGPGDSIFVFDGSSRRLTVLDGSGTYGRSGLIELPGNRQASAIFGVFPNGAMLVSAGIAGGDLSSGIRRDPVELFAVGPDGVSTVGRFSTTERMVRISTDPNDRSKVTGVNITAVPLGHATAMLTADTLVLVATGDRFDVELYSRAGRLIRRMVAAIRPGPVTDEDRRQYLNVAAAGVPSGADQVRVRAALAEVPSPPLKPAYDVVLAAGQEVWAREYLGPWAREREGRWVVFDRTGAWAASATTPAGFTPTWIGGGLMVGTWLDADDLPHVRVYRLGR
ncbi:MAG: 6-bladed beta-propeller [Gemmatimonadales bacterium]